MCGRRWSKTLETWKLGLESPWWSVSEENCEGTQPLWWSRNGANWREAEVQTGRAERGLWHFALHTEASGSRAAAISYLLHPSWVRCDSSIAEFDSPKPLLTYEDLHLFQNHQNFYVLLWFLFYCCSHLVFHPFPHSSSPPLLLMVFTMLAVLCGLRRPCSASVLLSWGTSHLPLVIFCNLQGLRLPRVHRAHSQRPFGGFFGLQFFWRTERTRCLRNTSRLLMLYSFFFSFLHTPHPFLLCQQKLAFQSPLLILKLVFIP